MDNSLSIVPKFDMGGYSQVSDLPSLLAVWKKQAPNIAPAQKNMGADTAGAPRGVAA
jgi:hypothetical protein